jgi:hypothetical protein
MCRGLRTCSVLGNDPAKWSRECPLPPPAWFNQEMDKFAESVRSAVTGDLEHAKSLLMQIRSNDLREWYVEHGQNSGGFRQRILSKPKPVALAPSALDPTRSPSESLQRSVFRRDGFRCRYCGLRLVPPSAMKAFGDRMGPDLFQPTGTNRERHGVVLAFRACADHVLDWKHGGKTAIDNLVTACWSCNFGKYYFTLEQLGLDDPRARPAMATADWDGLMSMAEKR